jgi:hypothetical protein
MIFLWKFAQYEVSMSFSEIPLCLSILNISHARGLKLAIYVANTTTKITTIHFLLLLYDASDCYYVNTYSYLCIGGHVAFFFIN